MGRRKQETRDVCSCLRYSSTESARCHRLYLYTQQNYAGNATVSIWLLFFSFFKFIGQMINWIDRPCVLAYELANNVSKHDAQEAVLALSKDYWKLCRPRSNIHCAWKNCADLFLSKLTQISTDFKQFLIGKWQMSEILCGVFVSHLTWLVFLHYSVKRRSLKFAADWTVAAEWRSQVGGGHGACPPS